MGTTPTQSFVLIQAGRFPQVSNIVFEFDPKNPSGSRIVSVRIGQEALQLDKKYVVATRGYMARGKGKEPINAS